MRILARPKTVRIQRQQRGAGGELAAAIRADPVIRAAVIASVVLLAVMFGLVLGILFAENDPDIPDPDTRLRPGLYVAVNGSDKAPGTLKRPFRTIGRAVRAARPGTVVYVREGTYRERVDFARSGTKRQPVVFQPFRGERVVVTRGFRVTGDFNVVKGFVVTPGETSQTVLASEVSTATRHPFTAGQVQVVGDNNVLREIEHSDAEHQTPEGVASLVFVGGSHNRAIDIDFHDCRPVVVAGRGSGEPSGTCEHNAIEGGTIHHTTDLLITIEADHSRLEGVDLHDPGQVGSGGNSADAINLNGRHITIRENRIHRVFAQHETQHTDAIQWWNCADDLRIEDNVIGSQEAGGRLGRHDQGHIQFSSESQGATSQRVVISGNTFLGTDGFYIVNGSPTTIRRGQADDWRIVDNDFRCPQRIRDDLLDAVNGWVVQQGAF